MNAFLGIGAAVIVLGCLVGLVVYLFKANKQSQEEEKRIQTEQEKRRAQQQQQEQQDARPAARRNATDRLRRRVQQRREQAEAEEGGEGGSESEGEQEAAPDHAPAATSSIPVTRAAAYEEKRRKKDAEREAFERAQEEEILRAEEERKRREDEEASKWMNLISIEDQGTDATEEGNAGGDMLSQFVDYIITRKTVPLEELAIEFRMRTTEVIDRVASLEAAGRLTGVMDDRGKYIYISREEMESVAKFITSRGRIAIGELATKSNTFIDLEDKSAQLTSAQGATLDFDDILGVEAAA